MREPLDSAFHRLRESVCGEFMLPVFGVQVFLDFTDESSRFRHIVEFGKIVIHDRDVNVFGHALEVEPI